MIKEIKENLKQLGFKANEIKIYIALTQLGESSAAKIAKKADLPRTTAISVLNKLAEEGYLTTHKYRGTIYYWIESPKTIGNMLEHKIEVANKLNESLTSLYRSEAHFPFAKVYDSKTSIRKFIEKTLASTKNGSIIYTIDSPDEGNYRKVFSDSINNTIIKIKNKKNITTHTLVPYGSFKGIETRKLKNQNIVLREMPEKIKFETSFWIIDDLIVHFSGNPPFIVAIKHESIVPSMKSIYDYLWSESTEKK